MATENKCPHCGKPVPTTALEGICPECMLKAGLAETGEVGPDGTAITKATTPIPRIEELAPHFPQLEILECLGRGGMGAVYKARQPRLDRFVALKILSRKRDSNISDAEFAARFQQEARALARLNHPDIVAVHDFGEAGGFNYLIMEFVDGLTLRQLLQTGKLAPEQALTIVPKICEALQFAHERGIVHRDIKPENILLDKQGRVKIADFGIAKILDTQFPERSLTGAKDVIGTPHYMAPEQVETPAKVDHRADIFSLGVVFYEMLTGELPLGKFAAPSKKVHVDVRLDEVVLHALEKEPGRRYQHANQVKTDVETIAQTPGAAERSAPAASVRAKDESVRVKTARQQVKGPAMGLVVTGILNWVGIPLAVMIMAYFFRGQHLSRAILLFVPLMAFVFSCVMIVAGLKMKRLEAYPLAIVGSIFAMLVSPGNLIGFPIGIWSLVVLSQREVRQAFGIRDTPGGITPPSRWVLTARWTARVFGTLLLAFYAVFVFAEGLPPIASQPEGVQLNFVALGLMFTGFIIGWKREGAAALLIASGWTLWQISENAIRWDLFQTPLPVGMLYGFCWWATRGRRTGTLAIAVLAFTLALGVGRVFVPTSIFVRGVVRDAQSGQPIADAELRLPLRVNRAKTDDDRPNARTGQDGRFTLYVGWLSDETPVTISAPNYQTLTTSFGPRPPRRNMLRDFHLQPKGFAPTESSVPPVVVETSPVSGTTDVDPGLGELRVTFSKPMQDGAWSWVKLSDATFPEMAAMPRYLPDNRTCVLPVKLQPNRLYALWINFETARNFQDPEGKSALPYLLIFQTRK